MDQMTPVKSSDGDGAEDGSIMTNQKAGCDLVSISMWRSCLVRVQRTTVEEGLVEGP